MKFFITICLIFSLCFSMIGCSRKPKYLNEIAPGYSQHAVIIFEDNSGN